MKSLLPLISFLLLVIVLSCGTKKKAEQSVTQTHLESDSTAKPAVFKFQEKRWATVLLDKEGKKDSMSVYSITVLSDSRCPTDVVCVWEGQVKVLIKFKTSKGVEKSAELTLGAHPSNQVQMEDYVWTLTKVSPHPKSNIGFKELSGKYTIEMELLPKALVEESTKTATSKK